MLRGRRCFGHRLVLGAQSRQISGGGWRDAARAAAQPVATAGAGRRVNRNEIERLLTSWSKGKKLYGHLYDDVVKLKYLHQRYVNYLRWLRWKG